MKNISDYFNANRYVVIKNFLDRNTSNLLYNYCVNKVLQVDFYRTQYPNFYRKETDGIFGDGMTINESYACYGDLMMDTLLQSSTANMQEFTGTSLNPQYTYWRMYETGDDLQPHIDRESCEISTTLCLGYDTSNISGNYIWSFFIKSDSGDLEIKLEPGDMLIYKGCEVLHWREPFLGRNHAQVFMHYNNANGKFAYKKYDTRPLLGLPTDFRR